MDPETILSVDMEFRVHSLSDPIGLAVFVSLSLVDALTLYRQHVAFSFMLLNRRQFVVFILFVPHQSQGSRPHLVLYDIRNILFFYVTLST